VKFLLGVEGVEEVADGLQQILNQKLGGVH
jgi:hypothetical protein